MRGATEVEPPVEIVYGTAALWAEDWVVDCDADCCLSHPTNTKPAVSNKAE
jgi:hypothetical protein